MSDFFNSTENKYKLIDLLGKNPKNHEIEAIFPSDFVYTEKQAQMPKAADLAAKLTQAGLTILKPRDIPTLERFNVLEVPLLTKELTNYLEEQEDVGAFPLDTQLPTGDTSFIPKYYPTFKSNKYDHSLYNQILYQELQSHDITYHGNKEFIQLLDSTTREKVFCSGTIDGMINRLKDMNDIRQSRKEYKGKPLKRKGFIRYMEMLHKQLQMPRAGGGYVADELGIKDVKSNALELGCSLFYKYFPIFSADLHPDFPGLFNGPFSFVIPPEPITDEQGNIMHDEYGNQLMSEFDDYLPPIGQQKKAGLPWLTSTKGMEATSALILAETFWVQLNEIIQKADVRHKDETDAKLRELLMEYWYLGCGLLFPKAEVYVRSELMQKTRNIWSMPFSTHDLIGIVSNIVVKDSTNILNDPSSLSLYKFSPYHGGMDSAILKALSITESTCWVYADNIYLIYLNEDKSIDWYSIDLTKCESQVQPEDAAFLMYYFLTRGHCRTDGAAMFSTTWAYYCLYIYPNLVADSTALIGNIQIKMPGEGSGHGLTAQCNFVKAAQFCIGWELSGKPKPNTNEFDNVVIRTGIHLKIETTIMDLQSHLNRSIQSAPDDGYFGNGEDGPPSTPPYVVELDLLGYGAFYSKHHDLFIPILMPERLAASTMLPKRNVNAIKGELQNADFYYNYVRYQAMRVMGCFNYSPVDKALTELSNNIRNKLIRRGDDFEKNMKVALSAMEISTALEDIEIPSMFIITPEWITALHSPKDEGMNIEDRYAHKVESYETKHFTLDRLITGQLKLDLCITEDINTMVRAIKKSLELQLPFDSNKLKKSNMYSLIVDKMAMTADAMGLQHIINNKVFEKTSVKIDDIEEAINPRKAFHLPPGHKIGALAARTKAPKKPMPLMTVVEHDRSEIVHPKPVKTAEPLPDTVEVLRKALEEERKRFNELQEQMKALTMIRRQERKEGSKLTKMNEPEEVVPEKAVRKQRLPDPDDYFFYYNQKNKPFAEYIFEYKPSTLTKDAEMLMSQSKIPYVIKNPGVYKGLYDKVVSHYGGVDAFLNKLDDLDAPYPPTFDDVQEKYDEIKADFIKKLDKARRERI